MDTPQKWREYECGDYFQSPLAEYGWWDEESQCWYVEPADSVYEDGVSGLLVIGGPGVDGIRWGYRRDQPGVWAHYPIEDEFVLVAASASELRVGYSSGRIQV